MYFGNGDGLSRKKWLKADGLSRKIYIRDHVSYPQGFHFFFTQYGARKYRDGCNAAAAIKQVRVRGIHTIGTDYGCRVGVARELFVP